MQKNTAPLHKAHLDRAKQPFPHLNCQQKSRCSALPSKIIEERGKVASKSKISSKLNSTPSLMKATHLKIK